MKILDALASPVVRDQVGGWYIRMNQSLTARTLVSHDMAGRYQVSPASRLERRIVINVKLICIIRSRHLLLDWHSVNRYRKERRSYD